MMMQYFQNELEATECCFLLCMCLKKNPWLISSAIEITRYRTFRALNMKIIRCLLGKESMRFKIKLLLIDDLCYISFKYI